MKKILATGASNIGKAGVATMVYRWGQEFDSSLLTYDYLMQNGLPDPIYLKKIDEKGGHYYTRNQGESKSFWKVIKWISSILKTGKYDTIHINADSAYLAAGYIVAAKRAGTKSIIVHSHCSQIDENNKIKRLIKILLHRIFRPYVLRNAKYYLACSKEAGVWMFGEKGIKSEKYGEIYTSERIEDFEYNSVERKKFRNEFGIQDSIVIGNIGRFSYQKNHEFLIKVFSSFCERYRDAFLVLVGVGPLKERIIRIVRDMGLSNRVIFLQDRNDIRAIYSAMDIFVMTSFFEGMPATLVEAQMSFLPCVVYDNVTHAVKFTEDVTFLNTWEIRDWIDTIEGYIGKDREAKEKSILYNSDFNIKKASEKLGHYLVS